MSTAMAAFFAAEAALILVACLLIFFTSLPRRWLQRWLESRNRYRFGANDGGVADHKGSSSRLPLPPGPPAWPILGHLPHFARHGFDEGMLELNRKYGAAGLFTFKLGSTRLMMVTSPKLARVVVREQDGHFLGRMSPPFGPRKLTYLEDQMPFIHYGPHYRFQRRLVMQEMLNMPQVAMFRRHRESEFNALVRSIQYVNGVTGSKPREEERAITLRSFVRAAFLNALSTTAMGQRMFDMPGEEGHVTLSPTIHNNTDLDDSILLPSLMTDSPGKSSLDQIVRIITSSFTVVDLFPSLAVLESLLLRKLGNRLSSMFADMDAFLQDALDNRRREVKDSQLESQPQDVLDILLSFRDADDQPLSNRMVKAQLQLMILAAVDSATITVEWALAELLRHPECMRQVREEMDRVVGSQRQVEEADLPNLPYFRAVVTETLRAHNTGAVLMPRRCTHDTELAGYRIPADTIVLVNTRSIQLDSTVWSDADRFLPDRFLNWAGPDINSGHEFRHMPFGSGRRMCPGLHLGSVMINLALAKLLHNFDLWLPGELKHRPQDLCMLVESGSSQTWKRNPLLAVLSTRLPAAVHVAFTTTTSQ